jgi:hypothetical protein
MTVEGHKVVVSSRLCGASFSFWWYGHTQAVTRISINYLRCVLVSHEFEHLIQFLDMELNDKRSIIRM